MYGIGSSRIGLLRKDNEDSIYVGKKLFVVADGMGGYHGGEIASQLAVDIVTNELEKCSTISEQLLQECVRSANEMILDVAFSDVNRRAMGTTIVIASVEKERVTWANVGDSRIYHFTSHAGLVQISKDHSYIQELLDAHEITKEEQFTHPKKNVITRAVGVDEHLLVDTGVFSVATGSILLLCSDGLCGYVEDVVIEEVLRKDISLDDKLEECMSLVYQAGARDNVSIVLVEL